MKGKIAWLVRHNETSVWEIVFLNPYTYYEFVKKIVYFEVEED